MSSGDRERFSNVTAAAADLLETHDSTTSYNKSRRCTIIYTIYALVARYNGSHEQRRLAVAAPTRRSWREVSTYYYFILLNGFGPRRQTSPRIRNPARPGHIYYFIRVARAAAPRTTLQVFLTRFPKLQTIYTLHDYNTRLTF